MSFVFNKTDTLYCQDSLALFDWVEEGTSNPSALFPHPTSVPSAALCSHWGPGPVRPPGARRLEKLRPWSPGLTFARPPVSCSDQGRVFPPQLRG